MPNPNVIDALGQQLATAALRTLIRLCPEVRTASTAQLDAACAEMRRRSATSSISYSPMPRRRRGWRMQRSPRPR